MSYKTAEYNFTLSPKPTEFPNVVVNSTPIRQKGDTLNYVVSALGDQKVVENTHSQDGMMRNYNNIICEYPMDKIIWGGRKIGLDSC